MKQIFLVALSISFIFLSCDKDRFETKPQIDIQSFGPEEIENKDLFKLVSKITDKEGDLKDTIMLVHKYFEEGQEIKSDTFYRSLVNAKFPDEKLVFLEIGYSYGEAAAGYLNINLQPRNREFAVGLTIKDKAGNVSDYVESRKILLKSL